MVLYEVRYFEFFNFKLFITTLNPKYTKIKQVNPINSFYNYNEENFILYLNGMSHFFSFPSSTPPIYIIPGEGVVDAL